MFHVQRIDLWEFTAGQFLIDSFKDMMLDFKLANKNLEDLMKTKKTYDDLQQMDIRFYKLVHIYMQKKPESLIKVAKKPPTPEFDDDEKKYVIITDNLEKFFYKT